MRDEIEKDRAAGTPGPWEIGCQPGTFTLFEVTTPGDVIAEYLYAADARRIARLPALEDAYLAACELADAADYAINDAIPLGNYEEPQVSMDRETIRRLASTLAKFRSIK